MAQLMPLPLTVSCFSKIQIGFTFLVPAHPDSPGQRAVKWMCVAVCLVLVCVAVCRAASCMTRGSPGQWACCTWTRVCCLTCVVCATWFVTTHSWSFPTVHSVCRQTVQSPVMLSPQLVVVLPSSICWTSSELWWFSGGRGESYPELVHAVLPSVLWCCWLGGRKVIRPVKRVVGCWRVCLSGAMCRLAYGPADATAPHCLLLQ